MSRLGLELPSEAQWRTARAEGRPTPTGPGWTASLAGAANLADAYGKSHGGESWATWEKDFDDGNTVHAEVGSYRANPFGLHDVHGNVWEWCRDGYDGDFYGRSPRLDPVAESAGNPVRASRGGSFMHGGAEARSSVRVNDTPAVRRTSLGPGGARLISPSPAGRPQALFFARFASNCASSVEPRAPSSSTIRSTRPA
jgi:formylglycine-generating enzyme required for sulfatase activity